MYVELYASDSEPNVTVQKAFNSIAGRVSRCRIFVFHGIPKGLEGRKNVENLKKNLIFSCEIQKMFVTLQRINKDSSF